MGPCRGDKCACSRVARVSNRMDRELIDPESHSLRLGLGLYRCLWLGSTLSLGLWLLRL